MAKSMHEILAEVDALFQRPALAHAAWVEVIREEGTDYGGVVREGAIDMAASLIGLGGGDGESHTYLRLSVRLLASNSQLLGSIDIDETQIDYPEHLEVVHRCMWWCAPRRLPLILAETHGWLARQFQAPAMERIATWDFRYPFGVPTEQLSIQRQLPVLVQVGWRVEQAGLELRLTMETQPTALSRGVGQVIGTLNSLFGEQNRPVERSFTTVEAGAWGFRITTVHEGRVQRTEEAARADIGAITVLRQESQCHQLRVFAAHGVEQLFSNSTEQLQAHAILLVSALVGVP